MFRPSDQTSTSPRIISLALGLLAFCSFASMAEKPMLPGSIDDAIRMESEDALPRTEFYDTPALASSRPGDLLRQEPGTGYALPDGVTAVRILYHSLSADDKDVATSGVVLVPAGTAPIGGWPIIAWAHGTSGVARQCAPSLERDMEYGEEGAIPMVRAGFAVVATDYHGLGTEGPHEYLNKTAHGHDVIFSIPAARSAVAALGQRWVVIGRSQGGLAAWSVAEMQATLQDSNYLGAVSVAGAVNLKSTLLAMGKQGSAASFYLGYMAYAIHVQEPSFQPSDMLTGAALKHYSDVTTKGCWNYAYAASINAPAGPVLRPGWDQTSAASRFFEANEVGRARVGGPLYVIAGEADETVPYALLRAVAKKACSNGVALTFRHYSGLDHATTSKSTPDQLAWVRDRFNGKPNLSNCASLAQ